MANSPEDPKLNLSEHPTVLPDEISRTAVPVDALGAQTPLSEMGTVVPSDHATVSAFAPIAAATPVPQLLAGRYRLLKELGRGGMGAVYLAHDEVLRLQVAVKVLLPGKASATAVERMRAEAALAIRLTHPNIMRIYDMHMG